MFSEILNIKPKLDQSDLRNMERSLSRRFMRVARGFGRGLARTLKGGAALGAITGILGRLLNPLKEVQGVLDRILATQDNLSTFAGQLGTSSGALAILQALGQSTGVSDSRMLKSLTRFQAEIGKARLDPKLNSPVRNFTQYEDTAEGFFRFVQGLQQLPKPEQAAISSLVFGERALVEMSEFFQTDFAKQMQLLGLNEIDTKNLTGIINKNAELQNLDEALLAGRNLREIVKSGDVINEETIRTRDRSALIEQDRNLSRIGDIENLARMSEGVDQIMFLFERSVQAYGGFIGDIAEKAGSFVDVSTKLTNILDTINSFRKGTFSKFLGNKKGRGDD